LVHLLIVDFKAFLVSPRTDSACPSLNAFGTNKLGVFKSLIIMSDGHVILDIEETDKFQFVDYPILITANLVDQSTGQRKLGETSNVKVLLAFEGNASVDQRCREHHPNLLEVLSNTGIQEDGTAKIEIKIKDVSMNHDNQKFVVYLEAYRPHGENNIICAVSNPINCVRHKLVLSESYDSPYIWYKDEGAKDKCIRILVKLIDSNKNLVKDRSVVLVPSLIYTSGLPVQPANVLNLFHDRDKPFMIGHNGTEVVRFRVNEVSRNHRKQLFSLHIAPDLNANPSAADISPAFSLAFEVKSKRTSDAKKEQSSMRNDGDDDGSVGDQMGLPTPKASSQNDHESILTIPMKQPSIAMTPGAAASQMHNSSKQNESLDAKSLRSLVSPRLAIPTEQQSIPKLSGAKRSHSASYQDGSLIQNSLSEESSSHFPSNNNYESTPRSLRISTSAAGMQPTIARESSDGSYKAPPSLHHSEIIILLSVEIPHFCFRFRRRHRHSTTCIKSYH
jgi:hypothetical protein